MTNIWDFLFYTLTVSFVAAVLLIVKYLLNDKLSPRWQYGVWSVLFIRMILPTKTSGSVFLQTALGVETLKGFCEKHLSSSYTAQYAPVSPKSVLPFVTSSPKSITDVLFAVYTVGVLAFALRYILSYIRLRLLLKKGVPADENTKSKVLAVCRKYNLKPCRVICAKGLQGAFVCGVIRPVLVVPSGMETDEKVILHEMLHLKHFDILGGIVWCAFRCLHWCNPFLHYVFNRAENDMESLCDTRVLEKLEGEERRDYGRILLSMANSRYARMPGSSSISNGGKNISRRIESIVRFKKYPKGMALVSVCIVAILLVSATVPVSSVYDDEKYRPKQTSKIYSAMATARITRCKTVAGALDTYAKGLLLNNGVYIACASSLSKHEEIENSMLESALYDGWAIFHLDSGKEFRYVEESSGYAVFNLKKLDEKTYEAILGFTTQYFTDEDGNIIEHEDTDNNGGCVLVRVKIKFEDAWVVEETGKRITSSNNLYTVFYMPPSEFEEGITPLKRFEAVGETGKIATYISAAYYTDNEQAGTDSFTVQSGSFSTSINPNAKFSTADVITSSSYECIPKKDAQEPKQAVGFKILRRLENGKEAAAQEITPESVGSSSDGSSWACRMVDESFNGTVDCGSGSSVEIKNKEVSVPDKIFAQIYWDGELAEQLELKEVS